MTTYLGNSGTVNSGANAVGEVTEFSVTETEGTVEDTALGDTARSYKADALPTFSGSITCHHFPGDTNGQATLLIGESISFELNPHGEADGAEQLTGTGIITSREVRVQNAQITQLAIQFQGTGALTHGTHSS